MPTSAEAQEKILAIASKYLKQYYDPKRDIDTTTRDQFKKINKSVLKAVEASYKEEEALDGAFEERVMNMLEAKKDEVLGGGANGNGVGAVGEVVAPVAPAPPPAQAELVRAPAQDLQAPAAPPSEPWA